MSPYYVIELGGSIQVDGRQRETALRLSVYMGLGPGDSTIPKADIPVFLPMAINPMSLSTQPVTLLKQPLHLKIHPEWFKMAS